MIALDEDALICDLAETYHIYDYRAYPLRLVATLAGGLGYNSRIRSRLVGNKAPLDTILAVKSVDLLNMLLWSKTKDAQSGRNAPEPLVELFIEGNGTPRDAEAFDSPDDFEAFRARIFNPSQEDGE